LENWCRRHTDGEDGGQAQRIPLLDREKIDPKMSSCA
jgi:hypothetical protein